MVMLSFAVPQKVLNVIDQEILRRQLCTSGWEAMSVFSTNDPSGREQGEAGIAFLTSGETGKYLIVTEGISAERIAGDSSLTFDVKSELN